MMRLILILFAFLLIPLPSPAQQTPTASASPVEATTAAEIDQWRDTLGEASARVDAAREQVATAESAYRDARKRRRRGAQRADLLAALEAAQTELAEAEAALPALLEEARRAGVPAGVLREFED
jgi:hypothetical protein